ncbi:PadR family transcriptional regulator [Paenibacillus sp. NPDC058174]|uniref:PadR family transcriptional regulator n=1 Tax=Paenibacillus sp. NPDC058174 TaxID=3346366 RepID=UPI0036DCE4BD
MSLQIFILGVLNKAEHHPYDVKKMILDNTDNVVNITDGNLYYNFDVLLKKGHIEKAQVVQTDNRPEKTTYRITDSGKKALEDEIYTSFKNAKTVLSLYASIAFIDLVDKSRLAFFVEEAMEKLHKRIDMVESKLAAKKIPDGLTKKQLSYGRFIATHTLDTLHTELKAYEALLDILRSE